MKHHYILALTLLLSGCGVWSSKPEPEPKPSVTVVKEQVPLSIYQPPDPVPVQLNDLAWVVITKENLSEKMLEIERITGNGFVVMAITPRDYENLATNMQELKRFIREQRAIILYYRDVTKTQEDWRDLNKKQIEAQRQQFEASKD